MLPFKAETMGAHPLPLDDGPAIVLVGLGGLALALRRGVVLRHPIVQLRLQRLISREARLCQART